MIGLTMEQFKRSFFDRSAVIDKLTVAERKVLSKYGAFVRTSARSSIRRSKKSSEPGQPPRAHATDEPNLKSIFFAYDADNHSVVVGPIRFNTRHELNGVLAYGIVPEILEKGGEIGIREKLSGGKRWRKWVRLDLRRRMEPGQQVRIRRVKIAARPFIKPADAVNRPKFPALWRDSVLAY